MTRVELKKLSKQQLKGNWATCAVVMLIYFAITGFFTYLSAGITSIMNKNVPISVGLGIVGIIGTILVGGFIAYGLARFFMTLVRTGETQIENLISGFKIFGKVLGLYIMMAIFVYLWTLLFVVPGIIAIYRYRMAYYILIDNPDMGIMEAISESKKMMDGHKGELFVLDWSFILWEILGMLTLGIGMLWVSSYMFTTEVNYYEYLRGSATVKTA